MLGYLSNAGLFIFLCAPSFFFFEHFLAFCLYEMLQVRFVFSSLILSAISPGSPGSFHRRMVLRNQAWQVGDKRYFYCSLNFTLFPIRHKPHLGLAVFLTILSPITKILVICWMKFIGTHFSFFLFSFNIATKFTFM